MFAERLPRARLRTRCPVSVAQNHAWVAAPQSTVTPGEACLARGAFTQRCWTVGFADAPPCCTRPTPGRAEQPLLPLDSLLRWPQEPPSHGEALSQVMEEAERGPRRWRQPGHGGRCRTRHARGSDTCH